jgi:hypothetical protein
LKSRLEDSRYATLGYQNLSSPVIRLRRLSDNELLALVRRLTKLYSDREGLENPPLNDEEIGKFMDQALSRTGADEMITPREIIRDYLTLLNILRDNKEATFSDLLSKLTFTRGDESGDEALPMHTDNTNTKVSLFDIEI